MQPDSNKGIRAQILVRALYTLLDKEMIEDDLELVTYYLRKQLPWLTPRFA